MATKSGCMSALNAVSTAGHESRMLIMQRTLVAAGP